MRTFYVPLLFSCLAALSTSAQFSATITVTDSGTSLPLENASVSLDGNVIATDATGQAVFSGLLDNTYDFSVTAACYQPGSGIITIAGVDELASIGLVAANTNNVFFFIGSPLAITGATVQVTDSADFNETFVTTDPFGGEFLENVPYGDISYTITIPCYETVTGTVAVDCNNGDGIAVFTEPAEATTNNVFFFIGSPLAITGATVQVTDSADFTETFVTSDPFGGEFLENVPYGDISYTITIPCYETVTGTVAVDCNNGDGIAVFEEPTEIDIDASVTLTDNTLSATASGLDYQWVDCNNNNEPIAGADEQSFEATESGNYAVILTSGICSLTSVCTNVIISGLEDVNGPVDLSVYPNPFNELLTVRLNGQLEPVRIELFSLSGQVFHDKTQSGLEMITVPTEHLASGSYVVRLTTDNARTTMSVVK